VSGYLGRRLALLGPTLFLVLVATFLMIRLAPGDPALAFVEDRDPPEAQLAAMRHRLGLDRPVPVQFLYYFGRVLRGDLGRSYFSHEPVLGMILRRLPFTVELAVAAQLLSIVIGIPLGVAAATRRNSWLDHAISGLAAALYSTPRFWVGLLLVLLFAVHLGWFPVIGGTSAGILGRLHHLVLPSLSIALAHGALLARTTRGSLLDVLRADFVRTAHSKGLPEPRVLRRHALRNALLPVATIVGLSFGRLLGGSLIAETVFVRPGVGTLLVEAVRGHDYPVVQGTIFFLGGAIVFVNILVDLIYALIDPRIRLS